jgi:hypothetical protein
MRRWQQQDDGRMKTGKQERRRQRKQSTSGKRTPGSLAAHGAFAPILGLWGAALGGLATLVLPHALIASLVTQTGLAAYSGLAQPVLAGLAALVLGGVMFAIAAMITRRARRRADTPSIAEVAGRRVRPIDPARDLGSRSLDDPLETMPFATPAWQLEPRQPEPELHAPEPEPQPEPDMPAPVELDLAQFAELPGRNAVWVEEQPASVAPAPLAEPTPTPAPVAYAPFSALRTPAPRPVRPADPSAAALARLRAVAPSELSMAEMVERFAGALHEQRSAASGKALSGHELAAREAALAEALKSLAALSNDGSTPVQGEPLRAALARLQGLRGAA